MPEWFKLIGVLIVVVGLALRLRTTIVVVVAGFVTGLFAGLPLLTGETFAGLAFISQPGAEGIINMLGRAFTDNRLMTLFIITFPAIGLSERFGLQTQARKLIARFGAATPGRLAITYQLFRVLHGILGLRLNGHPTFVRPLVFPMAAGAHSSRDTSHDTDTPHIEKDVEHIKAASAAAENYGNFYGQNLSPAQAGILLVYGVMQGLGLTLSVWHLVLYAIPITLCSVILGIAQFTLFDLWLKRRQSSGS
ncbi:MAG: DUF969 domain-containing protein [Pyrinomonadaceae bacterium MAG19_C2-C3]|nr:DUF969 domain-containing protein [Pyrinomonadaceae bacterium MAG19_C2-C3]